LLRVTRPLRGLLLYLRKAYHPADFARVLGTRAGGSQKLLELELALIDVHRWLQKF